MGVMIVATEKVNDSKVLLLYFDYVPVASVVLLAQKQM